MFGTFEPLEVLLEYDCPRTFTLLDHDGGLCLAHWLDENREVAQFVVVPFTESLLAKLRRGEMTLFEALDQPRVYCVELEYTGDVRSVCLTRFADLPADALPQAGAML